MACELNVQNRCYLYVRNVTADGLDIVTSVYNSPRIGLPRNPSHQRETIEADTPRPDVTASTAQLEVMASLAATLSGLITITIQVLAVGLEDPPG